MYLELVPNVKTTEFIKSFKAMTVRRGRPKSIYPDNAENLYKAGAKWLKNVIKKLHQYLNQEEVNWKFNLSQVPWWRGQFERIIGLKKQNLYQSMGRLS